MRIVVALAADERKALCEMARCDLRDPRDQLRYVLREAARTRGLLPTESQPTDIGGISPSGQERAAKKGG